MNKKYFLLIFLLIYITKINAQFVGYYNLHDGGVDMPSSQLYVLLNNEFVLFYYAGYKTGKWKNMNENHISLTETKTINSPFLVYAKEGKNKKIRLNVYGLYRANAMINFEKDTITNKEFQPIFNIGANCLANDYNIEKNYNEYDWFTLTIPNNPQLGKELAIKYPYKTTNYTFPINKKYALYTILYNEDALNANFNFILAKNKDTYTIDNGKEINREDLTDDMLKGIEKGKKSVDKEYDFSRYGNLINISSSKETITYKPIMKPIFTAVCKDDEGEGEQEIGKQLIPTVDRINGFYTVVNFNDTVYDVEKYELAQKPSITKEDILSFNKIVSDYGGYEIQVIFTEKGTLKFAEFSKKNTGKPFAIVVNKLIISTPIFYSEITGGKAIISGNFSESEIDEIITNLKK